MSMYVHTVCLCISLCVCWCMLVYAGVCWCMYPSIRCLCVCTRLCMYLCMYLCALPYIIMAAVHAQKEGKSYPTWLFHAQKEGKSYPTRLSDWPPSHGGARKPTKLLCGSGSMVPGPVAGPSSFARRWFALPPRPTVPARRIEPTTAARSSCARITA